MARTIAIQDMATEWMETKSQRKFKEIMDRLTPGLHNHISAIEKNPDKRTEILNDTFSKVWSKIDTYNPQLGSFSTWVYRIVTTEALLSKRHTNRVSSLDEMVEYGNIKSFKNSESLSTYQNETLERPADCVIDDLYAKALDAIKEFPTDGKFAKWKQALVLREIEGKQFNEIGELMGVPEKTVTGWVCKARKMLASILQETSGDLVKDYKNLKYTNEN